MKQSKLTRAYNATEKLAEMTSLPVSLKWDIFLLRKKLFPHIEFQREQQIQLVNKYNATINTDNTFSFKTTDDAEAFAKDWEQISEVDIEIDPINKLKINLSDIPEIDIHTMEAIEDFIEFYKE